jgi:hypothetical protein
MALLRAPVLAALLVAWGVPVAAETVTLGRASIDLPDGWQRRESGTGIFLSREFPETEDAGQAAAMIQIVTVDGRPEGWTPVSAT